MPSGARAIFGRAPEISPWCLPWCSGQANRDLSTKSDYATLDPCTLSSISGRPNNADTSAVPIRLVSWTIYSGVNKLKVALWSPTLFSRSSAGLLPWTRCRTSRGRYLYETVRGYCFPFKQRFASFWSAKLALVSLII
ncbi:hypothetical protein PsYK624_096490 [Phanerochaete sordida]|uniref:Uncharacterized protein n=1 Tax=Phanerochaete sordida TaxID=48140 RepID=A0A9P3LFP3_9APHY|nr:hypothetical protein PsYK624_096490 [Phanerochaete sordida]